MKILSLFDGMSCGQIALNRAGIEYDEYYASEIDKYAMIVTKCNYPNTKHIGDVTKIKSSDLPQIDLLIGGSPCQSFSGLGDGSGFNGKSKLFFEYLRILEATNPKYFLLENVKMKNEWRDKISEYVGVEPIEINSNLVSAQNRSRYYWTNIQGIVQPENKNIFISDIIEDNVDDKYFLSPKAMKYILDATRLNKKYTDIASNKSNALLAGYTRLNGTFVCVDCNGKTMIDKIGALTQRYAKGVASFGGDTFISDLSMEKIRRFTPLECERLQTVPDNYTNHVSDTQRYKMLGNGWTVDVISHIFKNIKKC